MDPQHQVIERLS